MKGICTQMIKSNKIISPFSFIIFLVYASTSQRLVKPEVCPQRLTKPRANAFLVESTKARQTRSPPLVSLVESPKTCQTQGLPLVSLIGPLMARQTQGSPLVSLSATKLYLYMNPRHTLGRLIPLKL